ncbi:MAG TPA: DUF5011 domain-containing protein, partial [Bacilli bacterium]|nr:DUF5011 domain-containing protein [Bacilli bacterium]
MNLKRFILFLFIAACGLYLMACGEKKTDTKPEISGVEDVEIEKGSTFKPLEGVTAYDEEDGDLTDKIQYTGNINVNV